MIKNVGILGLEHLLFPTFIIKHIIEFIIEFVIRIKLIIEFIMEFVIEIKFIIERIIELKNQGELIGIFPKFTLIFL